MKNEISSLDLYYLVKEFKVLEGSKIDRIYHSKNNSKELNIVCHISGKGRNVLRVNLPGLIFIDDGKEASESPTGFGMMLRKYLEGGRIRFIEQKDFERVVTIIVEVRIKEIKDSVETIKIEVYYLIVELFSKGNIIFCDENFKILNILEEQEWKDRILKRGEIFKYPKSRIKTITIQENELIDSLKNSGKESVVKAIAISLNLGGVYAEELCMISGIEKDAKLETLKDSDYKKIHKNLILIMHREPKALALNGDIYPFELESLLSKLAQEASTELKTYESFSEAIRSNFDTIKHHENKKGSVQNIEKIQNVITEQEKTLEEARNEYESNQRKAEMIYEKYQEIDSIIKTLKDIRQKHSWNEIRQKLKDDPKFSKIIKDIDEKNSSVIIEIDEI